jgi:hypothetical protein
MGGSNSVTCAKTPDKTARCAKTHGPMYSIEMRRFEPNSSLVLRTGVDAALDRLD